MMHVARNTCSAAIVILSLLTAEHSWADQAPAPTTYVIQATIARSGYSMAFGFGSLWMMSGGRLARVDPKDNSTIDIDIPAGEGGALLSDADKYRGIAIGEGAIWIPDVGNSVIYKVDPETNKVVLTIPTFIVGSQGNIGVGGGSIWVVTFDDHDKTLTRYNPDSGGEEAQITLPRPSKGVLVDYGKVWVAAAGSPELYVVDPSTNRVAATIPIHANSHLLASGVGAIWIGYDTDGLVEMVDGSLNQILWTIETGVTDMESDGDITVGGGSVWMITRGSTIAQIDPETQVLKGILRPPAGTIAGRRIRYGAGSLWVSGSSILRIAAPE
jgi:virginiamycin B lyase